MNVNDAGISLITKHEGVRLTAYQDSVGVWTIGYGHTGTAKPGMKITQQQAVELLKRDVSRFEDCVNDNVTVSLTQGQFNALVSFAFNLGCGGFRKSSVLKNINAGNYKAATTALSKYNKAGGKTLSGLTKRRKAEIAMFNNTTTNTQGLAMLAGGSFLDFAMKTSTSKKKVA